MQAALQRMSLGIVTVCFCADAMSHFARMLCCTVLWYAMLSLQVREAKLLRQLSQVMRQASAAGGFFDAWMKHNSDLVQATASAYAGKTLPVRCSVKCVRHFM